MEKLKSVLSKMKIEEAVELKKVGRIVQGIITKGESPGKNFYHSRWMHLLIGSTPCMLLNAHCPSFVLASSPSDIHVISSRMPRETSFFTPDYNDTARGKIYDALAESISSPREMCVPMVKVVASMGEDLSYSGLMASYAEIEDIKSFRKAGVMIKNHSERRMAGTFKVNFQDIGEVRGLKGVERYSEGHYLLSLYSDEDPEFRYRLFFSGPGILIPPPDTVNMLLNQKAAFDILSRQFYLI